MSAWNRRDDEANQKANQHHGHAHLEEGDEPVAPDFNQLGPVHQMGIRMISS